MRALTVMAAVLLATAACSKNDSNTASQTRQDLSSTGKDLAGVAHQATTSSDWAKARADLRRLGHDIGVATRRGAAKADVETKQASDDAKRETRKLAAETRRSAHHLGGDARPSTHEAHRRAEDNG